MQGEEEKAEAKNLSPSSLLTEGAAWAELMDEYASTRAEIANLAEGPGSEDSADALWERQSRLLGRLARHRSLTTKQIAQKLKAALTLVDETSQDSVRSLLESAIGDLEETK